VRFVGTLARRVVHALFGGRRGKRRSTVVHSAGTWQSTVVPAGTADIGPAGPASDSVLDEACRRAAQAAVIEPEEATGDSGLLERLVSGRHDARQEAVSERTAERIAELEGTIAAEEDDRAAARAAAERARDEWHEDRAAVAAATDRVDAARDDLNGWRRERNALPLRARGYVGHALKWILVLAVALALAPLVYLSMEYLDDPVVQILVTVAASAGIFAAEHAIGFGMAHIAQHVGRRARLGWLFAAAALVTAAMVGAEVYAGHTRDQASALLTGGTGFDATAAAHGTGVAQPDAVSMMWTVPLGIGATIAGSLIVALYVLGGPGRDLGKRIREGKALLAAAEQEQRAVEPRAGRSRARYEQAEAAAGAIAGRSARARAEIRGADLIQTSTIADARSILASRPVDVVLLDVHLPDGLGLDLANDLRQGGPERPAVLALTASVLPIDQQAAIDAGCDAFLPKPFAAPDLLQLVLSLARARNARIAEAGNA